METNNEKKQRKQAKNEKELQEFRAHELEKAYRNLMGTPDGRRVLMHQLRIEETIEDYPMRNGAFQTAEQLGVRKRASELYALLRYIDIEAYQKMELEYCNERKLERESLKRQRLEQGRI